MAAPKETAEELSHWLAEEWGRSFAAIVESMADVRPECSCSDETHSPAAVEGTLNVAQEFSLGPDCVLLVSIPEVVWHEAGVRVLRAVGIEEAGRDDALSTFQEILSQTFSGVAQALTTKLGDEVTCTSRTEKDQVADDASGLLITVELAGAELKDSPVFISPAPALLELIRNYESADDPVPGSVGVSSHAEAGGSSMSKTFDLLLGVHLPVSVSFGKTSLMVKEVLKLTTGSIVELNRAVTEPVDIIVNNCVIARGEVVVVAGNYGVRVKEIVSREQRYETGLQSTTRASR